MRAFSAAALVAATCLAGAQALAAQPAHLSDAQYIEANRCVGLMSSKALGTPDAAAMKQLVKTEIGGRMGYIYDKADQARDDAQREANRNGPADTHLVAERDGVCRELIEANAGGAGPHSAAPMMR